MMGLTSKPQVSGVRGTESAQRFPGTHAASPNQPASIPVSSQPGLPKIQDSSQKRETSLLSRKTVLRRDRNGGVEAEPALGSPKSLPSRPPFYPSA